MCIKFDITCDKSALEFLSEFLQIHSEKVYKYIKSNPEDCYVEDFIELNNINIGDLILENVEMVVLHVTSNNDNCTSIKKYGLLNLQQALTMNTPLKKYLQNYKIEFDVCNNILCVNSNFKELKYYTSSDGMSKYQKKVNKLARKIYYDYQINGFFCVRDYREYGGRIHERPEFLNELKVLFKDGEVVEDKWINSCTDHIIKFTAPLDYFAWNTFYIDKGAYENDFASKDELKRWLINKALYVIWSYYYYKVGPREIIAFLKPEVFIPYESIIIENN